MTTAPDAKLFRPFRALSFVGGVNQGLRPWLSHCAPLALTATARVARKMETSHTIRTAVTPVASFFYCALLLCMFAMQPCGAAELSADVIIYGATPAGIAAATQAAREGASVILIEESAHTGGLTSSGLSHTDFKSFESLGGAFREFMARVEQEYVTKYGRESQQVKDCIKGAYYEPGVARKVFSELLGEQKNVSVLMRHRLTAAQTEAGAGGRKKITGVTVQDLEQKKTVGLRCAVFIDATYEGDLLAAAGAAFVVGCEAKATYGESLAPVEANRHVQCYNFRVTLTKEPANRLPIPRPESYNRDDYAKLIPLLKAGKIKILDDIVRARPLPNNKADFNDRMSAPVSLRIMDANDAWPEGTPEVRAQIYERFKSYSLGLFHFLQTDTEVPEWLATDMKQWGLPQDEFAESGHWPPLLYVREGRRLVGEYVFTEKDTQPAAGSVRAPAQMDAVAIGDYQMDSHGTHTSAGGVTEGVWGKSVRPFQIPYRCMLPKEVDGLLVPVAVSSSHVGFCALRMEPTWMALGQAAGLAAAQALKNKTNVRDIDVSKLQRRLHELGAKTVYVSDVAADSPYFKAAQYIGTRGFFHGMLDPKDAKVWNMKTLSPRAQWTEAYPYHTFEPGKKLDGALVKTWLQTAAKLQIEIKIKRGPQGAETRGELLNMMFAGIQE